MINAKSSLNTQQLKSIEDCIREAETKTEQRLLQKLPWRQSLVVTIEPNLSSVFLSCLVALSGSNLCACHGNDGTDTKDFSLLVQVILMTGFLVGILVGSLSTLRLPKVKCMLRSTDL